MYVNFVQWQTCWGICVHCFSGMVLQFCSDTKLVTSRGTCLHSCRGTCLHSCLGTCTKYNINNRTNNRSADIKQ